MIMGRYRLFYSWQNDNKDTKKTIQRALNAVVKRFEAEEIELFVDQDTRERVGKRNIEAEVLEKIRNCDIFLADLTPIITYLPPKESHDLPKHMPNSNVMYEYGYALHAKGENRMIVLASLDKQKDEHIEYMPFDINHDTITLFSDENSLKGLYSWIKKIINDVDAERAAYVPQYSGDLFFTTDAGFTSEVTIHPRYKHIRYVSEKRRMVEDEAVSRVSMAEAITNPIKMQQAIMDRLMMPQAKILNVKAIHQTTNHSFVPVYMVFMNRGSEALDNLQLSIKANDDRVKFDDSNVKHSIPMLHAKSVHDTLVSDQIVSQDVATLNPSSSIFMDAVYIRAPHDIGSFLLEWNLSSRTYQTNGEMLVNVEAEYEYERIENDRLAGTETVVDFEESE